MNQFLEACGAASPLQVSVEAPGAATREIHSFDLPFAIVGRVAESDLRLDHPEVSERHAYFQLLDGRLVFLDLGSHLGIQQAGKRRKLGLMQREPAARIGPYRLRFLNEDSDQCRASASNGFDPDESEISDFAEGFMAKAFETAEQATAAEGMILSLSHRSSRRSRVEARGGIALVGSGTECAIRLMDPSVSSVHGSLVQTPQGTWLIDLLGKGGIMVNGRAVNHARLFPGDEAQIGASAFRVDAMPTPLRDARAKRATFTKPQPLPPSLIINGQEPSRPKAEAVSTPVKPPERPKSNDAALMALSELREDAAPSPTANALMLPPSAQRDLATTGLSEARTAEIVERVVSPLLDQLTEMRRQMLDEFHQARVMMFETIGSLKEEQSAIFNKELEQLRQLTAELEIHRKELAQQAETLAANVGSMARHPRALAGEPVQKSLPYRIAEREPEVEVAIVPAARAVNGMSEGYRASAIPHDEQIHAVLCDRITRLKDDHQTRWQKLLGILPGTANGKS